MEDKIISLCYVSKRNDKSTELCRIADYENGEFVPYRFTGTDFYDTDRDLIYGSSTFLQVDQGSIGVFVWSVFRTMNNEWRTETSKASDVSWCEVIYSKYRSIEQLVQALKNGYPMNSYDRLHDIILCCSASSDICNGLYISKDDAVYRDSKLYLNDRVVSLAQDTIDTRYATGDCKCRYSPYDTRKYLARKDACHVVGSVEVKSRDEIIGEIIKKSIGKDTLARKERQAARAALDSLSAPSIAEEVSARLNCTTDAAQKAVEEYITRTRMRLDSPASQRLLDLTIENDSELIQRIRSDIQAQWETEQSELLKEAERRREAVQAELEAVKQKVSEESDKLRSMQVQQEEAEEKAEKARMLLRQTEAEIQKKLDEFKNNYASALVENAVLQSAAPAPSRDTDSQLAKGCEDAYGIIVPKAAATTGALEENLDVAESNWAEVCSNREMAKGLTIVTFAAYAGRHPLLVVGDGAIEIADLISSSVCGQPSIKVCSTKNSMVISHIIKTIEQAPNAPICFINGLSAGYECLRMLMHECPHRMFIVTEPHAESLAIEPPSLFTTFLPVFCDYFFTGSGIDEYPIYDCLDELTEKHDEVTVRSRKEAKAFISKWFDCGYYPPALRERCADLLATMNLLTRLLFGESASANGIGVEFVLAPLMKCLNKPDPLISHLRESAVLERDRLENLISFIGTED